MLFFYLDAMFGPFELDAAASHITAKCSEWFGLTAEGDLVDAFEERWGGAVWLNPPYGRGIGRWVEKAYTESRGTGCTVTMLIFARTDTRWWHDFVTKADSVTFIKGRVRFLLDGKALAPAPAPSCVVRFAPWSEGPPAMRFMDQP